MGRKSKNAQSAADVQEVTLLDEDGSPSYEFYESLVEVFGRFDVDGDNVLCNTELRALSRAANTDHSEFSEDELTKIKDCFEWRDGLTLQGFLRLYMAQARNDEAGAWADLYNLGYNRQLELPQMCANAKFKMTRNVLLQLRLEEFVNLAVSGDVQRLISALTLDSLKEEKKLALVQNLERNGGAMLSKLAAELKCCATGKDVVNIDGDQEKGPVSFHYWSPTGGADGTLTFVSVDGHWRLEDPSALAAAPSCPPPPQSFAGKKFKNKRR
eukprot:TRINITY_DN29391_c0_g1_i1.p1 TRINITY_DN29391_c0_g1~~TRINITY_DN29391_c0_g1_i1.p1  ORF type:complete len:270 (-),score=41.04 TRINITY_DN29391_c0_g1_i1:110-919(-)